MVKERDGSKNDWPRTINKTSTPTPKTPNVTFSDCVTSPERYDSAYMTEFRSEQSLQSDHVKYIGLL